ADSEWVGGDGLRTDRGRSSTCHAPLRPPAPGRALTPGFRWPGTIVAAPAAAPQRNVLPRTAMRCRRGPEDGRDGSAGRGHERPDTGGVPPADPGPGEEVVGDPVPVPAVPLREAAHHRRQVRRGG